MNLLSDDTSIHIQGGIRSYKFPKQNTSVIWIIPKFFLSFFPPAFYGESPTLYNPF